MIASKRAVLAPIEVLCLALAVLLAPGEAGCWWRNEILVAWPGGRSRTS